jgi:hypothetical protein
LFLATGVSVNFGPVLSHFDLGKTMGNGAF